MDGFWTLILGIAIGIAGVLMIVAAGMLGGSTWGFGVMAVLLALGVPVLSELYRGGSNPPKSF